MSERLLVATELGKLFSVLSHPDRILIVEELAQGEKDVQTLADKINVSHSRASQHLSKLKSLRLVVGRSENKHHYYRLVQPVLAKWILDGLEYSELHLVGSSDFNTAVKNVRKKWDKTSK